MDLVDFSECKFIQEIMRFYTYYDFCDNRNIIKKHYYELSENGKLFYKWYVYSNEHMDTKFKNAIWDYLNDYDERGINLLNLKRFYKAR